MGTYKDTREDRPEEHNPDPFFVERVRPAGGGDKRTDELEEARAL